MRMAEWGVDVFLTASQKALGLPPGLALLMASPAAISARAALPSPPPLYYDWQAWLPVLSAYEERRPSYFSTPATNLVLALEAGLGEILDDGVERRVERHRLAAEALAAAWRALGLDPVPARPELAAHTLSALRLPEGVDGGLVGRIAERGVMVAGGLHPALAGRYFRVGHMGYTVTRPDWLRHTVRAVAEALTASGHPADPEAALAAFEAAWSEPV
jgi:alanine-glyoxylate transaminase/serine-glyoxylate transaminase/serine-pyruvate transaminase